MSDGKDITPEQFQVLIDAGFTADELEGIGRDIQFGATLAGGYGADVHMNFAERNGWTPAKTAAWETFVDEFFKDDDDAEH